MKPYIVCHMMQSIDGRVACDMVDKISGDGFVMCLPDPVERGAVKGVGLGRKGAASDSQFMQQAYELGKKI